MSNYAKIINTKQQLQQLALKFGVRDDWHEPDEQEEINAHRRECSKKPVMALRQYKCYWAADGYWISCNEVYEIMRKYDRERTP